MARLEIPMPPEMSFYPVFRQTPGAKTQLLRIAYLYIFLRNLSISHLFLNCSLNMSQAKVRRIVII
jgi:hypothetical protein